MLQGKESAASPISDGEVSSHQPPAGKQPSRLGGRRTHRACDRCRVKKSKCNGQQPCNTCKANERTCVFSALRRRDIRKWHCHMQDTVDEAIQRLYRACKVSGCFPGILPDENDGYVTTESILQGMGFSNLDIGPKAAGSSTLAGSQHLPLRTNFVDLSAESNALIANIPHPDNRGYPVSNGEGASSDSTVSLGSPHLQANYNITSIDHVRYHPHSPLTPLNTRDQLHELKSNQTTPQSMPAQHFYHHHRVPSHQLSEMHHADVHKHSSTTIQAPIQQDPAERFAHSHLQYYYRNQHPFSSFMTYDGDRFVSPQQVWGGSHQELTAASR